MKILRWPAVQEKVGYCKVHVTRLEKAGLFPKRIQLAPGGSAIGWLESEIDAWIEARVAERDGKAA